MKAIHIGLAEDQALQGIAAIADHLPIGASLGKIIAVSSTGVMALDDSGDVVVFGHDQLGDYAWRVADIDPDRAELTCWQFGQEIRRQIRTVPAD